MDIEVKNKLNPAVSPSQTISMDKVDGNWSSFISVRINNNDRSFSLPSDQSRVVTIEITVTEATLINLPEDSMFVDFSIYATSLTVADSPTTSLQVKLIKQSANSDDGDGASSEDDGELVKTIVLWSGFLIVIGVLGFITFKIVTTVEKDDDMDDWDDLMYEDSLTATYGAVASAPTVPMSAPPAPSAPVEEAPPAPPVASGAPPIPAEGLPAGWSNEQWNAYGQQYLDGKM
jgi:hypothetical protein